MDYLPSTLKERQKKEDNHIEVEKCATLRIAHSLVVFLS